MGYTKKTWTTGDVITADAMNNLEEGASLQPDYAQTDSTQPDYIKNKLVGKEVTYSDTLTWDGNTEGLESVDIVGIGTTFHKISDSVITLNDLENGVTVVSPVAGEIQLSYDDMVNNNVIYEDGFVAFDFFAIVPVDNYAFDVLGVTFPSKGIYASSSGGQVLFSSITVPNYQFLTTTTKKLTAEYLEPFEVVTKGGDTLTWDGDTSGKTVVDLSDIIGKTYVKVSDATPTEDEFSNGATGNLVHVGDVPLNVVLPLTGGGYFCDDLLILVVPTDNYSVEVDEELAFTAEEKGVYFAAGDAYISSLTIPNYTSFPTTEKKLKGEYLIDTNSIILKSSGGKRFKVTVSDTGTLTATEI